MIKVMKCIKGLIYNANLYESLKVARELWYLLDAYGCK